jgi:hypothetical protein
MFRSFVPTTDVGPQTDFGKLTFGVRVIANSSIWPRVADSKPKVRSHVLTQWRRAPLILSLRFGSRLSRGERLDRIFRFALIDLYLRGGRPMGPSEIWMDTYGNRPGRLARPLAMGYFRETFTRFLSLVRAIVLEGIDFESMKSICR